MRRLAIVLVVLAAAACGRPRAGLEPIYPPTEFGFMSRGAEFVPVDSLRPTLRWKPLASDPAARVTYEIRIWSASGADIGRLVYRRDRLAESTHGLEESLAAGSRYVWSVRAHFFVGGRPAVTEWGAVGEVRRDQTVPNLASFRFSTPDS